MATRFDISQPDQLAAGLRAARMALAKKEVVITATDTGYGLVANAFSPAAVATLREVKGWTEPVAPQVLMPSPATLPALAASVSDSVQALADAFWPGPLTIIAPAGDSLQWDLGESGGCVALRVPSHSVLLELMQEAGPLAATQASKAGKAVGSVDQIGEIFGNEVSCFLVDPGLQASKPSTVVDACDQESSPVLRVRRRGPVTLTELRRVVGKDAVEDATRRG